MKKVTYNIIEQIVKEEIANLKKSKEDKRELVVFQQSPVDKIVDKASGVVGDLATSNKIGTSFEEIMKEGIQAKYLRKINLYKYRLDRYGRQYFLNNVSVDRCRVELEKDKDGAITGNVHIDISFEVSDEPEEKK